MEDTEYTNDLVDGWDIYRSSNVAITNSYIINGDDCVSFKPNSTNILVENLYCSGSHGISVGSLGQYAGTQDIVQNVLVKNVTMVNAENGARIKAFGGSSSATSTSGGGNGYAQNITFQNFHCEACDLPIVIDQCYETSDSTCASYPSKVLVNDIHYINVTGTGTKSKEVVSLVCSDICTDITATGTSLIGTSGSSEYYCTNIASTADLDFPCSAAGSVVSASTTSTTKKTTTTTKTSTTKTSTTKTTTTKTSTTKTTTSKTTTTA
jgi:polygalacturonase